MRGAASRVRSGPLYIILASLCLAAMGLLVKLARQELSTLEIIAWRGLVAVPLTLALAWRCGLRVRRWDLIAARSVLGFGAMFLSFTALRWLSLADMALLFRIEPMLVAAGAPLLLGRGEHTGYRTWILLAVGLVGCVIIIAPEVSLGSTWGLLGVGAAVLAAAAHLCLRPLGRTEDPRVVVFWFQLAMMVIASAALFAHTGHYLTRPSSGNLLLVLGVGVLATAAQLAMTQAYRVSRAGVVAAANYTGPLWAALLDLTVFGVLLSLTDVLGGALVIGAGVALVFWRRAAPPAAGPQ